MAEAATRPMQPWYMADAATSSRLWPRQPHHLSPLVLFIVIVVSQRIPDVVVFLVIVVLFLFAFLLLIL